MVKRKDGSLRRWRGLMGEMRSDANGGENRGPFVARHVTDPPEPLATAFGSFGIRLMRLCPHRKVFSDCGHWRRGQMYTATLSTVKLLRLLLRWILHSFATLPNLSYRSTLPIDGI
ncbi:hypothetical protein BC936DRAFT_141143 [Jimgerdemannia flammicorona]|uniref:Uncharacterized protein n=1 Tax=Jimgerdemannia flammicorona TaxID=994334 RepID=A0A433A2W5_9FUNG|nr:hypothetical protein BC936DRAFT_141143 [Jimgerdemannia flammicorona]